MKILRPEVDVVPVNGGADVLELIDITIKGSFNITDDEYDHISEHASVEELEVFISIFTKEDEKASFTDLKKALQIRNKYVKFFQ